jgi:phosphohistidine phosphatase
MKRLLLVRHAKSSWKDERLADIERPLNGRGRHDAPAMAARLAARGLHPSVILSSPAERAKATAETLAGALGYPPERIRIEPDLYLADAGTLARIAARLDDTWDDVVLVAHNPGLTDFANRLLPSLALGNLPTTGIVAVDCPGERWTEIEHGGATLAFYDYPKNPDAHGPRR